MAAEQHNSPAPNLEGLQGGKVCPSQTLHKNPKNSGMNSMNSPVAIIGIENPDVLGSCDCLNLPDLEQGLPPLEVFGPQSV